MTDEVAQVTETPATQVEETAIAENQTDSATVETKEPAVDKVQKRIDKLTREKYQLRAELDFYKKQAEKEIREAQRDVSEYESKLKPGEPNLHNFDNLEDYVTAKAEWVADQKLTKAFTEREQKQAKQSEEQRQRSLAEGWQKRLDAARSTLEDLDDVIESADVPLTPAMAETIMESDLGPQVAYYLARNPAEAEKLAGMTPSAVARAIGRIEAKLEASTKQKSSAPKPVDPVGSRAAASNDPEKMSDAEWAKAHRDQQLKRKA